MRRTTGIHRLGDEPEAEITTNIDIINVTDCDSFILITSFVTIHRFRILVLSLTLLAGHQADDEDHIDDACTPGLTIYENQNSVCYIAIYK